MVLAYSSGRTQSIGGGEGVVAGTGCSWSHHIGSQEAERVNRGENQAIKLQGLLSSFTCKGSTTFHRDYLT